MAFLTSSSFFNLQALVRMDSDIPTAQRMKRVDAVINEVFQNVILNFIFGFGFPSLA